MHNLTIEQWAARYSSEPDSHTAPPTDLLPPTDCPTLVDRLQLDTSTLSPDEQYVYWHRMLLNELHRYQWWGNYMPDMLTGVFMWCSSIYDGTLCINKVPYQDYIAEWYDRNKWAHRDPNTDPDTLRPVTEL